jgi:hypothetical protein
MNNKQVQYSTVLKVPEEDANGDDEGLLKNGHESNSAQAFELDIDIDAPVAYQKGEMQLPAFRDKWFGIAFLVHLGIVSLIAVLFATGTLVTVPQQAAQAAQGVDTSDPTRLVMMRLLLEYQSFAGYENNTVPVPSVPTRYPPPPAQDNNNNNNNNYYSSNNNNSTWNENEHYNDNNGALEEQDFASFLSTSFISLAVVPTLSVLALTALSKNAVWLIQASLLFGIFFNAVLAVGLLLLPSAPPLAALMPLLFALILTMYAKSVWKRIPFAAANLRTAISAVQSNLGMAFLAICNVPLITAWLVLWLYIFASVLQTPWLKTQESESYSLDGNGNAGYKEESFTAAGTLAILALLLSLYWTLQVIKNVTHTTLAGTIGTWWFLPQEASSCCSRGLTDSLARSLTYSFGSICFGSLLVAILQVIKMMFQSVANNRRAGIFRCIAQCFLVWIERIAEYFNKWAFIYVGLYGYSYIQAGKNVFTLFRHRGWTTIITDSLIHRVLGMMCLTVGIVNASVACLLCFMQGDDGVGITTNAIWAFLLGIYLSSVVLGVLTSSVDSIIVLYAEAPNEFQQNHPLLAEEMNATWAQAWPDIFCPTPTTVTGASVV